jgi:hypothetical protein
MRDDKPIENVKTELDALKFFGWILPLDYAIGTIMAVLFILTVITHFMDSLLSRFFSMADTIVVELWAVWLLFRANYFVLQLAAMVKLLPDMAARIALPYLRDTLERQQEEPLPKISVAWPILREFGWVGAFDYVMASLVLILAILAIVLACLGQPWWIFMMAISLVLAFWIVQLGFRCAWFVLQVMADLKLLPQSTARLVLLFSRSTP